MRITAPPVDPSVVAGATVVATSAAASTPLGGDASGTPPALTVTGIGGIPVDVSGAANGYVLTYVLANTDLELLAPTGGGGSGNLDGGTATSTYGGVSPLDGGGA